MRIIQFRENQKETWNKFIVENCSESFLQAWEWGEFQKSLGRKIWRIGIVEDDLLLVALVVKYDLPFGRSYFYCPRGPVIGNRKAKDTECPIGHSVSGQISNILDFLFSEIKKIGKKEKSLFLRIDPPMDRCFHSPAGLWNLDAKFLQTGSTALPAGQAGLRRLWSQHKQACLFPTNTIQPRDTLILDITKSEEELLKGMKQKTRYNVRLAKRKGVQIKNIKYQISNIKYFDKFWELVEETSARDKFVSHSKDYYWKMLESLSESGGFHSPDRAVEPRMQDLQMRCHSSAETMAPSQQNLRAKLYLAEYSNKIIAANMVLYFGDMAIYLHGASSNEYRNVMASYLLQWRQIMDAKEAGCKKYDFWGIATSQKLIKSKAHKVKSDWSGITKFKKGFGGYEKNYIGAYDLVFDNIGYPIYEFMRKIKDVLK